MIKIKSISDVISNSSNEAFILRCRDHDSYDIFKGYFKDVIQQFATEHGLDDIPGKKMPFKVYRASVSSADNPKNPTLLKHTYPPIFPKFSISVL